MPKQSKSTKSLNQLYRPDLKHPFLAADTSSTVEELREGLKAVGKRVRGRNGEGNGTEVIGTLSGVDWKSRG